MFDIHASLAFYRILIVLHLVGASVWIGGHLVLATTILPRALRNRDPSIILDFEKGLNGSVYRRSCFRSSPVLLLAYYWSPEISAWFRLDSNVSVYVVTKLVLLTATLGLALNAKFRVIPNINRDNMHVLASHIVLVTVMSIGFLLAGIAIRTGGLFLDGSASMLGKFLKTRALRTHR
jgi:putative copper export protein